MLGRAVAYLKRGIELHPRRDVGWLLLAAAYRHRKEYALSRAAYEACLLMYPRNRNALANLRLLGQLSIDEGQWELAAEVWATVLRYDPGEGLATAKLSECYEALARAFALQGRADLAQQYRVKLQALSH
jgi:tetratricopeptide (TPR) repeat protein